MSRVFALALAAALATAVAAQDKWTDRTVKLRADTKLGSKQAGGLLRDGPELKAGQGFTVKSDDGFYLELDGETGYLFKSEVELFAGREMPKKGAAGPKADPKDLWVAGTKVLPNKGTSQIQFGDRDEKGRSTFFVLTGLSFVVVRDHGDGWVRVRDRYREGWVHKDDVVHKDEAVNYFDKAYQATPQNTWLLFMRAASHNERADFPAAVADYTEYLKLSPNNLAALNNRANIFVAQKDYDKAVADYTTVLQIDPKYTIAYSNRAHAFTGQKEYEKAVADCDKAIELDPKYGTAYGYRGRALAKLGRYEEALAGYETSVKLDPTAPRLNGLAWFLATCPDEKFRDPKKAVEVAAKAVELSGKDVGWAVRDTLAAAHAAAGDFDAAVAEMKKALEGKTPPLPAADDRKKMEARLKLYADKKPYRDDE